MASREVKFQWSLRSMLVTMAVIAGLMAALFQVPHVVMFVAGLAGVVYTTRLTWLTLRGPFSCLRIGAVTVLTIASWMVLYILSIGPFIAIADFEMATTETHHIWRAAECYRPALAMYHRSPVDQSLRWYTNRWISNNAVGLRAANIGSNRSSAGSFQSPLVGTWVNDRGTPFQFQSDGTGTYVSKTGRTKYLEWTDSENTLALYVYAEKRSAPAWFGRQFMGDSPTVQYAIIAIGPSQFQLSDTIGTYTFERTKDVGSN